MRRGRSLRGVTIVGLAALWLVAGLFGFARYLDAYYQYRGFAPLRDPRGVPQGRVVRETFFSTALDRQASYLVYLPPGYESPSMRNRRFPALYLLHGSPGKPENFLKIAGFGVRLDVLVRARQVKPMLLVMPDGRVAGDSFSDTEWANGARGRYADFVLGVVADADRQLRTDPARGARVLAGYSEGAFGAVNIGLHAPATFAGIEAWSGYYFEGRSGTFAKASQAVLDANSPLGYATSLGRAIAANPLRVFLYTGKADPQARQMAPLVAELRAAGAEAASAIYPGAHDWGLWRSHAADMLELANRDFGLAPRLARRASVRAARRAERVGLAVAAQARRAARLAAVVHDRQVAVCRSSANTVERSAADELARLSARGLGVVRHHLVRNCLITPPGQPVLVRLCDRLPLTIAIERRSALSRRRAITVRCLRAVAHG